MIQIAEQTTEQKVVMYQKLTKEELIYMLIQANEHLDRMTKNPVPHYPASPFPYPSPFWQIPTGPINPTCLFSGDHYIYSTSTGTQI